MVVLSQMEKKVCQRVAKPDNIAGNGLVGDDLCLSPIKTLDQNQQLALLGNLLWPLSVCYLVTFVSNIFIVHLRLIQLTQK